jgi:hypothetical protein
MVNVIAKQFVATNFAPRKSVKSVIFQTNWTKKLSELRIGYNNAPTADATLTRTLKR